MTQSQRRGAKKAPGGSHRKPPGHGIAQQQATSASANLARPHCATR
jgi:hypothetical protein